MKKKIGYALLMAFALGNIYFWITEIPFKVFLIALAVSIILTGFGVLITWLIKDVEEKS